MRKAIFLLIVVFVFFNVGLCSKDSERPLEEQKVKSGANDMVSFKLTIEGAVKTATINNNQVQLELPDDVGLTTLSPNIEISNLATINPKSGTAVNFGEVVTYTVTSENGNQKTYEVELTSQSSANSIISFHFKNLAQGQESYTIENKEMYKKRNEVERLFRRLKGFRRIFSRYDKLDVMFMAFIYIALIFDAIRVNTP